MDGERLTGACTVAPGGGWTSGAMDHRLRWLPAALTRLRGEGIEVPSSVLTVESKLPAGRGFSSSAATNLAVLDACARRGGRSLDWERLATMAYSLERDDLGVECGLLDPLACAAGAPLLLRWPEGDGLQYTLERLRLARALHLVVASFPAPRDTPAILRALSRDRARGGTATGHAFEAFEAAAVTGATALEHGDLAGLGKAMDGAQAAYERHLEASIPALRAPGLLQACRALTAAGALGAKFSGAGGDGSVIGLFNDRQAAAIGARRLEQAVRLRALVLEIGAPIPPVDGE